jgi:hypothetical protein
MFLEDVWIERAPHEHGSNAGRVLRSVGGLSVERLYGTYPENAVTAVTVREQQGRPEASPLVMDRSKGGGTYWPTARKTIQMMVTRKANQIDSMTSCLRRSGVNQFLAARNTAARNTNASAAKAPRLALGPGAGPNAHVGRNTH